MFIFNAGFSAVNISAVQNEAVLTGSVLFSQFSGAGVRNSVLWDNTAGALAKAPAGWA